MNHTKRSAVILIFTILSINLTATILAPRASATCDTGKPTMTLIQPSSAAVNATPQKFIWNLTFPSNACYDLQNVTVNVKHEDETINTQFYDNIEDSKFDPPIWTITSTVDFAEFEFEYEDTLTFNITVGTSDGEKYSFIYIFGWVGTTSGTDITIIIAGIVAIVAVVVVLTLVYTYYRRKRNAATNEEIRRRCMTDPNYYYYNRDECRRRGVGY